MLVQIWYLKKTHRNTSDDMINGEKNRISDQSSIPGWDSLRSLGGNLRGKHKDTRIRKLWVNTKAVVKPCKTFLLCHGSILVTGTTMTRVSLSNSYYIKVCDYCSGKMNATIRVQILGCLCFHFVLIPLGKAWIHLFSSRNGSLALVRQSVNEKENSDFKPAFLRLKIDLVSHPARDRGIWLIHILKYTMKRNYLV